LLYLGNVLDIDLLIHGKQPFKSQSNSGTQNEKLRIFLTFQDERKIAGIAWD